MGNLPPCPAATNTTGTPRSKAPKQRNTEARKEQNRIASKAYREKRKQKLALLDQILNSEDNESSPSSPSEASGSSPGMLSVASYSRHASTSPHPAPSRHHLGASSAATALAAAGPVTEESATNPLWCSASSAGQLDVNIDSQHQFADDPYFDDIAWPTGYYALSNNMSGTSHDYSMQYQPVDNPIATIWPTSHLASRVPSTSSFPSLSIHSELSGAASPVFYQHKHTNNREGIDHDTSLFYEETLYNAESESAMAVALDKFSRLNSSEQQQMLHIIQQQRHSSATGRGLDRCRDKSDIESSVSR